MIIYSHTGRPWPVCNCRMIHWLVCHLEFFFEYLSFELTIMKLPCIVSISESYACVIIQMIINGLPPARWTLSLILPVHNCVFVYLCVCMCAHGLMCFSAGCRNWSIWSWRRRTASCLWWQQRRAGWSTCRTLWHRCWTIPSLSGSAALCMNRSILTMWTSWGNSSAPQKTPWQVKKYCHPEWPLCLFLYSFC